MPQEPTLVVNVETGDAVYMHSIDASEAMRLGDYRPAKAEDVSPEARANALNRMRGIQTTPHPEMQTKEEREATRKAANEEAARLAGTAPEEPLGVRQALGVPASPPAPTPPTPATHEEGGRRRPGSS